MTFPSGSFTLYIGLASRNTTNDINRQGHLEQLKHLEQLSVPHFKERLVRLPKAKIIRAAGIAKANG